MTPRHQRWCAIVCMGRRGGAKIVDRYFCRRVQALAWIRRLVETRPNVCGEVMRLDFDTEGTPFPRRRRGHGQR